MYCRQTATTSINSLALVHWERSALQLQPRAMNPRSKGKVARTRRVPPHAHRVCGLLSPGWVGISLLTDQLMKPLAQLPRDRSWLAVADQPVVAAHHGDDLGGRARQEAFIRHIDVVAR